jgi:GLPGLI family protein
MLYKIIIIINLFFGFSQNTIEVYYSKAIKSKTANKPTIINGLTYLLTANKNASIMISLTDDFNNFRFNAIKGGGKGVYFKDTVKKERVYETESGGELVDILMPYKMYDWKLENKSKIISGFTCYKATAQLKSSFNKKSVVTNITVWYTPELNYPFGPVNYDGLPGLVLEAEKNGVFFIATKIILKPKKPAKIKKPSSGRLMTNDEFNKKVKEIENMIEERMKQRLNH